MPLKIKFLTILDNLNLVSITNNTLIQLRVQGEKVKGQGQFDGGTPMPRYCPIATTNGPEEMHLRALGPTSFTCADNDKNNKHYYACEYHRLFATII